MLNQEEAMHRLDQLRQAARTQRAFYEAYWAMACVYDHGEQWGYMNPDRNQLRVKFLRSITDPRREDVRVHINRIHQDVVTMVSKTTPEQIAFTIKPRSVKYRSITTTGQRLLQKHLRDIGALRVLRDKEPIRYVLGTSIVRRTLLTNGKPVKAGESLIKNVRPGWSVVYPNEILRDPAACTLRPGSEERIFCHMKAMPISWVNHTFGGSLGPKGARHPLKPEDGMPMGKLLSHQKRLEQAAGVSMNRGATDSNEPAVLVYECYFKDDEMELPGNWPWMLVGFLKTADNSDELAKLMPLHFGENPFYGLPFHLYNYDTEIEAPWGRGIPHLQKDVQDVFNVGLSWLARMMQAGAGKILYQANTIEDPSEAFNNRVDIPIPWRRSTQYDAPPTRLAPPQINPAVLSFLDNGPDWMHQAINLQSVLQGYPAGKRGESGSALTERIAQANDPLEVIRREDDLTTQDLLLGTYADTLGPSMRLDIAREMLGEDTPDEHIRELIRTPALKACEEIVVHLSMNRPKSPSQNRSEYVDLAKTQVMDPMDAMWEMTLRGDRIHTAMSNAFDKQNVEIQMLVDGQDIIPEPGENHAFHKRTIEWYSDQPEYLTLSDEAQQAIQAHWQMHSEYEMTLAMGQVQPQQQSGQPSPPAEATNPFGAATGPAGPMQTVA